MDENTKNEDELQNITNQILETSEETSLENSNDILENDLSPSDILDKIDTENLVSPEPENNDNIEKINLEDSNTTNCLALTIKEEHKLVAVKNVVIHSLKVTWKVIVSTIALNILKIFF